MNLDDAKFEKIVSKLDDINSTLKWIGLIAFCALVLWAFK